MNTTLEAIMAKKKPESVEKFHVKERAIDKIINTHEAEHSAVYVSMQNEFLRDDKGEIDYNKLDDKKLQDKVVDFMANEYVERAQKYLGASKPENEIEEGIVLQRYFGITREQLRAKIKKIGKDYTLAEHEAMRKEHIKNITQELRPLAHEHITEDDLEDIVKYIGAEDMIDVDRLRPRPDNAGALLRLHRAGKGKLDYTAVQRVEGLIQYVKDDYKKRDPAKTEKKK
jgi:hypothetical protein